jgi:hypothetical protein
VVDAGQAIPGYLTETENSRILAETFAAMAGTEGAVVIKQLRRDMELLARAYVIGDPESVMLFDRLAIACRKVEEGG